MELPQPPKFEQGKVVSLFTIIFYVLLAFCGLWLLYAIRFLFGPLLIAVTIALSLAPLTDRFEAKGWRRDIAILVIYACFLALLIGFSLMIVPVVRVQLHQVAMLVMPAMNGGSTERLTNEVIAPWLMRMHVPLVMRTPILQGFLRVPEHMGSYLGGVWPAANLVAGNLIMAILTAIAAYYLLTDHHKIIGKMLVFVKPDRRMAMLRLVNEVVAVFGNYVRGLAVVVLLDMVAIYVILRLLRIHNPETLAVLGGILYAVPYLGPLVSTILIGLVAKVGHGLAWALMTTAIMIVLHQILFNMIIAPKVIGRHVGLHPLWTIAAMMIGYTLMDIWGVLLSVPVAAAIQVVLVHLMPQLRDDSVAQLSEAYSMKLNAGTRSIQEVVAEEAESEQAEKPVKPAVPVADPAPRA